MAEQPGKNSLSRAEFSHRVALAAGIVALVGALVLLLWYASWVLLLIFAAILIGILLRSLANGVSRYCRISPGWALAAVLFALVGLAVLGGMWVVPELAKQFDQLGDRLPQAWEEFQRYLWKYHWGRLLLQQAPAPREVLSTTNPSFIQHATGFLSQALQVVVAVVVVFFVGLFMAAEPKLYHDGLLRLIPKSRRQQAGKALDAVEHTLRWWLIGQSITMVVIGTVTAIGLWLIGIELWLMIGLLAALFNFIPNFGPLISFIPAVLLAWSHSPAKAGLVLILYLVAQSLEGYILTPLVQRKAVALPPALTIVAQVLAGVLAGPLGVMLAAPLTAAALVLVKVLYVKDTLGDPAPAREMAQREESR